MYIDLESEEGAKTVGLEIVAGLSSGAGYDWCKLIVYRRKQDRVFLWYGASGCSCNGFDPNLDELWALNKGNVHELEKWVDEYDYWFSADERIEFKQKINALLTAKDSNND